MVVHGRKFISILNFGEGTKGCYGLVQEYAPGYQVNYQKQTNKDMQLIGTWKIGQGLLVSSTECGQSQSTINEFWNSKERYSKVTQTETELVGK